MTEPTRLLNQGSALARAVLGSVGDDVPPAELRRKIQTALLVGSAGTGVIAATAASKTSSFLAFMSGAPVVVKAFGVAIVLGAVAAAGTHVLARSPAHGASSRAPLAKSEQVAGRQGGGTPSATRVPGRDIPPVPEDAVAEPVVDHAPAPLPLPPEPQADRSVAPGVSAALSRSTPSSSAVSLANEGDEFAREVVALDSARAALDAGDLNTTIERLNRHDLDYPHGRLRPEALAIRIQAYAARHDVERVRELAARFLAQYPDHPFAARVSAMIESAQH